MRALVTIEINAPGSLPQVAEWAERLVASPGKVPDVKAKVVVVTLR